MNVRQVSSNEVLMQDAHSKSILSALFSCKIVKVEKRTVKNSEVIVFYTSCQRSGMVCYNDNAKMYIGKLENKTIEVKQDIYNALLPYKIGFLQDEMIAGHYIDVAYKRLALNPFGGLFVAIRDAKADIMDNIKFNISNNNFVMENFKRKYGINGFEEVEIQGNVIDYVIHYLVLPMDEKSTMCAAINLN